MVCSITGLIMHHEDYYFSDGHATDNLTSFYDKTEITKLPEIIDWNAVLASYWGGQDNLNIKRKKQAEFLVSGDVASKHIIGFGCYDNQSKIKLVDLGIKEDKSK